MLGNFFKYQTRKGNKTNLMIFLRPTVIRTAEQSVNVVNDRYDFIRGVQAGAQPPQTLVLPNMNAPLLPPLQDGRPSAPPLLDVRPRNGGGVQPIPSVTVPMTVPNSAPATEPVLEQNESR